MSVTVTAGASPLHRLVPRISAVRAIHGTQMRVTAVLALCLTLVTVAVYILPIMQIAWSNPLWAIVGEIAIGDQLKSFCLLIAVVIANQAADEGYAPRSTYLLAALIGCTGGVAVSEAFGWLWRSMFLTGPMPWTRPWLHGNANLVFRPLFALTNWLLVGSAAVFLYAGRRAAGRTAERLRSAELERIRKSKLALESRLQAMQARVEPQFLFNTLVQVEQFYELDPKLAARTLGDLIAYLHAAMPLMRDTSSTLAQELTLARAYLDILRVRSSERLAVDIETPAGGDSVRMPPMMVLPLIDHAVGRGFGPSNAEGAISIRTEVTENRLRLTITDTVANFVPARGDDGLATIRERLAALYGDEGVLQFRRSAATSAQAILDIPLEHRTVPARPA